MAAHAQGERRVGTDKGTRRLVFAVAVWIAVTLVAAGGLVAIDRAWLERQQRDAAPAGPATRVAGAVRSISGAGSVRRATYDAVTSSARVEVSSRYYDPTKPLAENQEYLATEGRIAAQLALHGSLDVQRVVIALYHRQTLLATVTGRQGDAFDRMAVEFTGPLVRP
jgi:hypothetical protein